MVLFTLFTNETDYENKRPKTQLCMKYKEMYETHPSAFYFIHSLYPDLSID